MQTEALEGCLPRYGDGQSRPWHLLLDPNDLLSSPAASAETVPASCFMDLSHTSRGHHCRAQGGSGFCWEEMYGRKVDFVNQVSECLPCCFGPSVSWECYPWGQETTWPECLAGAQPVTMIPSFHRSWRSWRGPALKCWTGEWGAPELCGLKLF